MRFSPTRFLLTSLLFLSPCTQGAESLEKKVLFSGEFPQMIAFRGEMIGPIHRSYETWSKDIEGHSAVIRKFWNEEIDIKPQSVDWAQRYMKEHPDVSFIWHLNAEARVAHDKPQVLKRYFPGHWALHRGVFIKKPVPAETTEFTVSDIKVFSERGFYDRKTDTSTPQDLVIVARKRDGSLDWTKCEYASIVSVDKKGGQITVKRGNYASKALDYGDAGIYIAPIVGSVWGNNRLWFYNHSTTCPKDDNGKVASDHFVEEILAKVDPEKGDLKGFSGIAFDVMYWVARMKNMDVNNDGIADGEGIVDGKHVWRDGMIDWLTSLREKVGPEFVLVSDSSGIKHQRAVGVLNGMESEGFPFHHDAFRSFSTPLNHFSYWKKFGEKKYPFNFSAVKYKEKADLPKATQYSRFAIGASVCADIFATRYMVEDKKRFTPIDELTAGVRNEPKWLGKALGPMIRVEDSAPDLFDGAAFTKEFLSKVEVKDGSYTVDDKGVLRLNGNGKKSTDPIVLTIKDIPRPSGDIVVSCDVKSESSLVPEVKNFDVPRYLTAKVDGLPDYPNPIRNNSFFNNLGGTFGPLGFINQRFYFRDLGAGKGDTITLHLTFENQGGVEFKSLQLLAASQAMAREFENGVILVNPSFDTYTFDLTKLFPNYTGGYRFIKGAQSPNNGEPITDATNVRVQSMDSLFLEKM
ncbi:hypothetical protein NT6N_13390 [Oceaniferula spumae]|uniref:Uncharacterized protein n=1 Tax=Oceaniferula spumae TaxID=2979115 RepID=A0AAT9FK02_9BACT